MKNTKTAKELEQLKETLRQAEAKSGQKILQHEINLYIVSGISFFVGVLTNQWGNEGILGLMILIIILTISVFVAGFWIYEYVNKRMKNEPIIHPNKYNRRAVLKRVLPLRRELQKRIEILRKALKLKE